MMMNATDVLSEQHRAIDELFAAVDVTDANDGPRLRELAQRLAAHMRIEEEILFPLARTTAGVDGPQTICSQVLRRMTDASGPSEHAKLAKVFEFAEAHLEGSSDAQDDAIDHE